MLEEYLYLVSIYKGNHLEISVLQEASIIIFTIRQIEELEVTNQYTK